MKPDSYEEMLVKAIVRWQRGEQAVTIDTLGGPAQLLYAAELVGHQEFVI